VPVVVHILGIIFVDSIFDFCDKVVVDTFETLLVFFLFLCSFPLGYLGGAVRALALHRLALGLQLRVKDLEDRLLREDRRFAGSQRWKKQDIEDKILRDAADTLKQAQLSGEDIAPWTFKP